jgi:hypothetical protein
MAKKFTALMLAGLVALPAVALADDLEDRVAALEEKAEGWDLSSRIHWSGDFRFRTDFVTGDAPAHYTALDIGQGVADTLDAGGAFVSALGAFGLDPNVNTVGEMFAALMTVDPNILADQNVWNAVLVAGGAGPLNQSQADTLWAIFTNPDVGGLLNNMALGGAPLNMLTGAFSSTENLVAFMQNLSPATRVAVFSAMGYNTKAAASHDNDTIYTNRMRLNLRAKAMENLEFKARLAMYKIWGMQNNAVDYQYNAGMGGGPFLLSSLAFDGSSGRQPKDNVLLVDRAFMNWNAIGGSPVWFSIGRRPVTDGPPAHMRMGTGEKMATPVSYMDYPFDGLSLGYAYENLFGIEDAPGRVRFCYGRGFEAGPTPEGDGLNDVDFGGISWDVFSKGNRFFNFQSFGAFNMFNVPDNVDFVNPVEYGLYQIDSQKYSYIPTDPSRNLLLDRANLGDIFHTSSVYMSKFQNLNYFVTGGWSHTKARGVDELGVSLLGSWWEEPTDRDGYSVYLGVRYDLDDLGLKLGAEYNWGSEYWISFTPGHDDLYASKLATRGSVYELYTIWDIPAGEAISQYSKAFFRLGYQHYDYEYTGSGFWLGRPEKIDELANDPLKAQFYTPIDTMDQVYLTMEAWF